MFQMLKAAYKYCQKDVREVASDIKGVALGLLTATGVALTTAVPTDVHAAIPTALTTAYDTAEADFLSLFNLAIPVMVVVAGSLLLWSYGKRFIKGL